MADLGSILGMVVGVAIIGGLIGWGVRLITKLPVPAADGVGFLVAVIGAGFTNAASFGGSYLMTAAAYAAAAIPGYLILLAYRHWQSRSAPRS